MEPPHHGPLELLLPSFDYYCVLYLLSGNMDEADSAAGEVNHTFSTFPLSDGSASADAEVGNQQDDLHVL